MAWTGAGRGVAWKWAGRGVAWKGAGRGVAWKRAGRGVAWKRARWGVASEWAGRGVREGAGRGRHLRGPQDGDTGVGTRRVVSVFVLQQTQRVFLLLLVAGCCPH